MKSTYIFMMMIYFKLILMIFMILCISYQFFNMNINPLNYMYNFMIFTLLTMYLCYMNLNQSLYTMMILISIIGGVMIMFNYFISLINNEKTKMNYYNYIYLCMFMMLMLMFTMILFMYNMNYFMFYFFNLPLNLKMNLNIYKIYMYPIYYLTILMMILLLIMMIMSFKMCTFKIKPLRKLTK